MAEVNANTNANSRGKILFIRIPPYHEDEKRHGFFAAVSLLGGRVQPPMIPILLPFSYISSASVMVLGPLGVM